MPDGAVAPGPRLLPESSGRRLNDGKPDPAGRYLVGSLCLGGASSAETQSRSLRVSGRDRQQTRTSAMFPDTVGSPRLRYSDSSNT
jgi:hypothetical protein